MAKYLLATTAFCLFASSPLFSDIQPNYPNTNPNLTQENPTTNNNAYPQNNIFAPQVVPNVNVGDPGMVDDQNAIFQKNNQDE